MKAQKREREKDTFKSAVNGVSARATDRGYHPSSRFYMGEENAQLSRVSLCGLPTVWLMWILSNGAASDVLCFVSILSCAFDFE